MEVLGEGNLVVNRFPRVEQAAGTSSLGVYKETDHLDGQREADEVTGRALYILSKRGQ